MARKKPQSTEKIDYTNIVWCIDNLSKDQLDLHDAKPYNSEEMIDLLHKLVEQGFAIGMKPDSYTGNMQISAVCYDANARNAGLAISARSDDLADMTSILLWKFFVVAEGDLRPFADKKPKGVRG